jgi:hypothetical protein
VRASDLDQAGIPRAYLRRLCDRGLLEQIDRGLYRLAEHVTLSCLIAHERWQLGAWHELGRALGDDEELAAAHPTKRNAQFFQIDGRGGHSRASFPP